MTFTIQVSNPEFSKEFSTEDETLSECIETSFPLNTEMALMGWNGVFIPLSYKYTISTLMPDILLMLEMLLNNDNGTLDIVWPSNDFRCDWSLLWNNEGVTIDTEWFSVAGKLESLLNEYDTFKLSKIKFCVEWLGLLKKIRDGVLISEYKKADVHALNKLIMRLDQLKVD